MFDHITNQKLTNEQIAAIKCSTELTRILMARYSVSRTTIHRHRKHFVSHHAAIRKLSDDDTIAIRASKESGRTLAARYGVSFATINRHRRGNVVTKSIPVQRRDERKRVIAAKRAQLLQDIDAIRWRQPDEAAACA